MNFINNLEKCSREQQELLLENIRNQMGDEHYQKCVTFLNKTYKIEKNSSSSEENSSSSDMSEDESDNWESDLSSEFESTNFSKKQKIDANGFSKSVLKLIAKKTQADKNTKKACKTTEISKNMAKCNVANKDALISPPARTKIQPSNNSKNTTTANITLNCKMDIGVAKFLSGKLEITLKSNEKPKNQDIRTFFQKAPKVLVSTGKVSVKTKDCHFPKTQPENVSKEPQNSFVDDQPNVEKTEKNKQEAQISGLLANDEEKIIPTDLSISESASEPSIPVFELSDDEDVMFCDDQVNFKFYRIHKPIKLETLERNGLDLEGSNNISEHISTIESTQETPTVPTELCGSSTVTGEIIQQNVELNDNSAVNIRPILKVLTVAQINEAQEQSSSTSHDTTETIFSRKNNLQESASNRTITSNQIVFFSRTPRAQLAYNVTHVVNKSKNFKVITRALTHPWIPEYHSKNEMRVSPVDSEWWNFKCMGCSFRAQNINSFASHLKNMAHASKDFLKCAYCFFEGKASTDLVEHMQKHAFDVYQCYYCYFRTTTAESSKSHREIFHPEGTDKKIYKILN